MRTGGWSRPAPSIRDFQRSPAAPLQFIQVLSGVDSLDGAIRAVVNTAMIMVVGLAQIALHGDPPDGCFLWLFGSVRNRGFVSGVPPKFQVGSENRCAGLLFFQLCLRR